MNCVELGPLLGLTPHEGSNSSQRSDQVKYILASTSF